MNKRNNPDSNPIHTQQKAENLLRKKSSGISLKPDKSDVQKLIQELEVSQLKLEMQNKELKLAKEKEAELATNKYIALYDFAPSGYFTLSKSDTIINLNLCGAEMLGEERASLLNSRFSFFVSTDTKPNFNRFLERAFSSKTTESCQVSLSTNINKPLFAHLSGIVAGNNEECFVTAIDITERMLAEIKLTDALLEAERFREALDHVSAYIYTKDTQLRYIYANKKTLELFGCTLEALVGSDDSRFFPPETVTRLREVDSHVLLGNQSIEEIDIPDPVSGRRVFWEIKNPLLGYSENNEVIGLMGISTDITERKRAEEALQESEERFHSLFDNLGESVALQEFIFEDGKPVNYRIIDVNKSFLMAIGMSNQDVVGKLSTEVFNTSNPPYLKEYAEVDTNKKPIYFETYFAPLEKHFAISVAPWRKSGFATIFLDITDRKRIEEEIILKNEELQKMNHEKDKFFSIIAHDLRSPFNSFLGLTQFMAEELPTLSTFDIQQVAISIRKSATNLYSLLENLLDWARMQQGLIPFKPDFVELSSVFDESLAVIEETLKVKKIDLDTYIPEKLMVFADKNMLLAVIRNLVSNAVKFTAKGGRITVSAKSIPGNFIQISVKDTGIGMNAMIIDNLFRLDVQISRNGTNGEPSSGLGLLLCKEFTEKNGGEIWAESEEGSGSTFFFTIPDKDSGHAKRYQDKVDNINNLNFENEN